MRGFEVSAAEAASPGPSELGRRPSSTRSSAHPAKQVRRALWSRPRTAVNTRGVLSERRRRFPQVLADDEGGLRRESHGTASVSLSVIRLVSSDAADRSRAGGGLTLVPPVG